MNVLVNAFKVEIDDNINAMAVAEFYQYDGALSRFLWKAG